MGRRTASYLLSASFAYWHQSCDIHQINRAVSVSPPRLQLLRHKASSEMFINIALLPPEWEPCALCSQGVYLFAPTCEQVNNNIAAHSFFPSELRFNRVESQSLVHMRHSSVIMGVNCENCDLWRASDVSDRCFFFFFLCERSQERAVQLPAREHPERGCSPESGRCWRSEGKMNSPFVGMTPARCTRFHFESMFCTEASL